jgi:hypothetical protein
MKQGSTGGKADERDAGTPKTKKLKKTSRPTAAVKPVTGMTTMKPPLEGR